jgi:hypothetical protein
MNTISVVKRSDSIYGVAPVLAKSRKQINFKVTNTRSDLIEEIAINVDGDFGSRATWSVTFQLLSDAFQKVQ